MVQVATYLSALVCLRVADLNLAQATIERSINRAGKGGPEGIQFTYDTVLLRLRAYIMALEAGTVVPYTEIQDLNDLDTEYICSRLRVEIEWLALGLGDEEQVCQQQVSPCFTQSLNRHQSDAEWHDALPA